MLLTIFPKNILIDPSNPLFYLERGTSYQEFNQHTNAINDFTKYISLKPDDPDAYFARAKSYEEITNFDKAVEDYNKITSLSEFDMKARKMLKEAKVRLYEIKRRRRSIISASAPAGRTNRNIGSEVATCTRATTRGSGLSPVISQPAAAFCIHVPMFETTVASHRTVNVE